MKFEFLKEVGSTNEYIKRYLGSGEDRIVCAERQSAGRGTKGRSFLSERGGVYLSALVFYRDLPASEAFRIMTHAAVAVCRTAERFGAAPEIKWANDVLVGGKKLCGILIENVIEGGFVRASIVGIGLNVANDLGEWSPIATSLSQVCARSIDPVQVRGVLMEEYAKPSSMEEYLSYVAFLGREIKVTEGARSFRALAKRILPDGRLEIEESGTVRALSAAEIKIEVNG